MLGRVPTIGRSLAVTALVAAATAAGCGGGSEDSPPPPESSTCGYLYEWTSAWRLPLQPDPHAAYSYVIPKVTSEPIGFVISGPSPYAAWTSWTIYNGKFQPFSVVEDDAIKADKGSVNPFVPGNRVLSENRNFELLVLPHGTDTTRVAQSLRDIPAANRLASPTSGKFFVIADRVYNAFPGYNRGGAAGPTKTPFPTVKAVNYETGDGVDCSKQNLLPSPKPPTEMPATAETKSPSPARVELADGTTLSIGSDAVGGNSALKRAQYAPELDPDRIEMTRPPLLPGADVSSIPPPDNCAGYLGAQTSPQKIGLIRLPHVARWFDTERLTPKTPFEQRQTTYISFTEYGAETQVYQPGSPDSGSLGNAELQVDSSGGATIVVWPEGLKPAQQKQVFAYAKRNDWALIRGGERGPVTTPNLFVRLKGASDTYPGRYSPTSEAKGVPCYFDEHPKAKRWSDLTGERYVASGRNVGPGAPQGVNCTASQFLGGSCLESLKAYIRQTGGSYVAG